MVKTIEVMKITKDIKCKLLEMLYGDLEYSKFPPNVDPDIELSLELENIIEGVTNGDITSIDQVDKRISKFTPGDISYKDLLLKNY